MPFVVYGLGNPGPRYGRTRHNVGYWIVDCLADRLDIQLKKPHFKRFLIGKGAVANAILYLVKPITFMNTSGDVVRQALRYSSCSINELIVVCDSLDLPVGVCRLKKKGTSSGQKGLESVIKSLNTEEFMRLRIGIGRPDHKINVVGYVLGVPPKREQMLLEEAVSQAADGIVQLAREGPERVMNVLNQSPP